MEPFLICTFQSKIEFNNKALTLFTEVHAFSNQSNHNYEISILPFHHSEAHLKKGYTNYLTQLLH